MAGTDPLHDALSGAGEHFALHVRNDDVEAATRALAEVAIVAGDLPPVGGMDRTRISPPAPLPDGVLVRIDDLSTRVDTRRRLAEAIRDALEAEEIDERSVVVADVNGLSDLDRCRRAAVLRLFPAPAGSRGRLDPLWIDIASEWVFGDQRPDATVRLRVLGVERSVRAAEAAGILHGCAGARTWCDVVTGDVTARVRTASISFGVAPHVAIAGGGPRCDDDGLLARFELLAEVARDLSHDCAYACIDFEESFGDLGTGLSHTDWPVEGGAPPNSVIGRLCDQFVPEAFGFQIIGSGHVERLTPSDPNRRWGTPLRGGRRELRIGEPIDWLLSSEVRSDVRADGWELLAPVMLESDDLEAAVADAPGRNDRSVDGGANATPTPSTHGIPGLDSIVIDAETHPRRGTRLTALELAAWMSGDEHTDDPASVSPVLRLYVRNLGRGLDDQRRQELKGLAPGLVDTDGSPTDERARAWALTDWLVRAHAPRWLRAAGLTESADRLEGIASITEDTDLVRAVDLMGSAIVTSSRRLEVTMKVAGERAGIVDQIAWDVWEHAAERTGWMAVSEAVLHEIPPDLAYAADARVVECSRDPRIRAQIETTTRGLGDAIWSAALQEIATTAWQGVWDAAEAFVRHESTFSIRTALRRSIDSEFVDLGDDPDADLLLDDVDVAVRDALTRLILTDDVPDFWARAIEAASGVERGDAWRRAFDETRRVLGAQLFDDAIDVARAELHRWLDEAPRTVGRAVAAAVAREASGVAGRGIAARSAADRLARGGSEDDASRAAYESVDQIIDQLGDSAIGLIDVLIGTAREGHASRASMSGSPEGDA